MNASPSMLHNQELTKAFIAKAGAAPRFPEVSDQVELLPLDTSKLPPYAYNPSICFCPHIDKRVLLTFRYHHKNDYSTRIGIGWLDKAGGVDRVQDLNLGEKSCEDARIFLFRQEPWISWVESDFIGQSNPRSVVKYAKLELPIDQADKRRWKIGTSHQVEAGGNDGSSTQKNWCFFDSNEKLFCIYESWSGQSKQVVWQIQGPKVVSEFKTPGVRWPYGHIRGGNIVPWQGKLLRLCHSSTDAGIGTREKRYYACAVLMEDDQNKGFAAVAVSKNPVIYGSEAGPNTPEKWCTIPHPRVVFPCGLVPDPPNLMLSIGVNDASCAIAKISPSQLNL